jgi:8-oxo-dGTP diphosphatase
MTLKPEIEKELRALLVEMTRPENGRYTIGPADVARRFGGDSWKRWMDGVKEVARQLALEGAIDVTRHGKPIETWPWRGVVRFKARGERAALNAERAAQTVSTERAGRAAHIPELAPAENTAVAPSVARVEPASWEAAPVFTEPGARAPFVTRPSAYALIEDAEHRLAIVRTPQGTVLPGGGIEGNETPERAIEREAREECGFAVRVGRWSVRAIQRAYSAPEKTHFEKPSTFCDARVTRRGLAVVELDHELVWVTHAQARELLSHESQRWAVAQWTERAARG